MNQLFTVNESPAEKLTTQALTHLSDSELLQLVTGAKDVTKVWEMANNNYNNLRRMTVYELVQAGLTKGQARKVVAACEMIRRNALSGFEHRVQISNSKGVAEIFGPLLCDLEHEEFHALYLNRANRVLSHKKLSQGGFVGTVIDVRMILKKALEAKATCIILCHNHPSGNIQPSEGDKKVTNKISEAANIMDIQVLDHIIISSEGNYYSFADEGLI